MDEMFDVIIIGGGPAATSAAMTLKNRGKTIAVVSNRQETGNLWKAEKITNYPGLPPMSGKEMSDLFRNQLVETGASLIEGRALSVLPMDGSFGVAVGSDYYMARSIILCAGITREKHYPGEAEFLGRGVSYCATCDGMLYRGKTVAVIGGGEEAVHDAAFLESIGCSVLHFPQNARFEILGTEKVNSLSIGNETHNVDGVFIIKDTVSVTQLVPGLRYENGGIAVDRSMATAVPGVFAAGDCTGKPLQLAKAVGEGNIAALSACDWIDKNN